MHSYLKKTGSTSSIYLYSSKSFYFSSSSNKSLTFSSAFLRLFSSNVLIIIKYKAKLKLQTFDN
jgi:hypothetical protein